MITQTRIEVIRDAREDYVVQQTMFLEMVKAKKYHLFKVHNNDPGEICASCTQFDTTIRELDELVNTAEQYLIKKTKGL